MGAGLKDKVGHKGTAGGLRDFIYNKYIKQFFYL